MSYNIDPIKEVIDNTICSILEKIAIDYKIDVIELKDKYGFNNTIEPEIKIIKKKGRKKKNKEEFTEMTKYTHEGNSYLMDKQNNIYTFNIDSPTHIGQKLVNGTIKFFD
jgi:hypothetical protein